MIESEARDVRVVFQRRLFRHLLTMPLLGVAVILYVIGTIIGVRHLADGDLARSLITAGEVLFVGGLVYGGFSTFFNLNCPACNRFLGPYVSGLGSPFVPDDYPTHCSGCRAVLIDDDRPRRTRRTMRFVGIVMFAIPLLAALVGAVGFVAGPSAR